MFPAGVAPNERIARNLNCKVSLANVLRRTTAVSQGAVLLACFWPDWDHTLDTQPVAGLQTSNANVPISVPKAWVAKRKDGVVNEVTLTKGESNCAPFW